MMGMKEIGIAIKLLGSIDKSLGRIADALEEQNRRFTKVTGGFSYTGQSTDPYVDLKEDK